MPEPGDQKIKHPVPEVVGLPSVGTHLMNNCQAWLAKLVHAPEGLIPQCPRWNVALEVLLGIQGKLLAAVLAGVRESSLLRRRALRGLKLGQRVQSIGVF